MHYLLFYEAGADYAERRKPFAVHTCSTPARQRSAASSCSAVRWRIQSMAR